MNPEYMLKFISVSNSLERLYIFFKSEIRYIFLILSKKFHFFMFLALSSTVPKNFVILKNESSGKKIKNDFLERQKALFLQMKEI